LNHAPGVFEAKPLEFIGCCRGDPLIVDRPEFIYRVRAESGEKAEYNDLFEEWLEGYQSMMGGDQGS